MTRTLPILPDLHAPQQTPQHAGTARTGAAVRIAVVEDRPPTPFVDAPEVVAAMTVGDDPANAVPDILKNRGRQHPDDSIAGVDCSAEAAAPVMRTVGRATHGAQARRKTRSTGCAVFGDEMARRAGLTLPGAVRGTGRIHATSSFRLAAVAIHGAALRQAARPAVCMEDAARHDAVDRIAGRMPGRPGGGGRADPLLHRPAAPGGADRDRAAGQSGAGVPAAPDRVAVGDRLRAGADADGTDAESARPMTGGRGPVDPRRRAHGGCGAAAPGRGGAR